MLAWQSLDPSGRPVSSQDFSNAVLLVDFWETTCEACVAELPDLERLYGSLQPRGLTIIGLALDLDPAIVEEYLTDNLIPYPIVMANPSTRSAFEGIYGAPTKYLVDQERKIVGRYEGGHVESFYRGLVEPLFRSSSLVRLDLTRDRDHITLSWPISGAGYRLEAADHPDALIWTEIGTPPQTNGVGYTVKLPAALPSQFFRLQKP
jgi:thiol-disulfide isomerase/thioredoxin